MAIALLLGTGNLAAAAEKDFADLLEFIGEFSAPDGDTNHEWEQLDQAKAAAQTPAARKAAEAAKAAADKPDRVLQDRNPQSSQPQQGKPQPERKPDN
jgi:hypothetical protein